MNFDWKTIGDKVFGILKGSGFRLQMFDKSGAKVMDPHVANRFFATIKSQNPDLEEFSILIGLHDENADSHMDIKTPNLSDEKDFDFIHNLVKNLRKNLGDREGLKINWDQFDHAIRAKDDAFNNITESKDIGKVYGHSLKTSYQRVGESKLIIRHIDSIDESKQGSRLRKIKGVFIETKLGERFSYPYPHIAGARAMARHLSDGGTVNDDVAEAIRGISEDYIQLKKAKGVLRKSGLENEHLMVREAIRNINREVKKLVGPRGYARHAADIGSVRNNSDTSEDILYRKLLVDCGCDDGSDDASSLRTAARYIGGSDDGLADGSHWVADGMEKLASRLPDQEAADQLRNMAGRIRASGKVSKGDVEFVLERIRGTSDLSETLQLKRVLQLGGIR